MQSTRRKFIKQSAQASMAMGLSTLPFPSFANTKADPIKIGIIGLDTSHSPAFTKLFNSGTSIEGFKVVAAYPMGVNDTQKDKENIQKYTQQVKELGVEIVDSIDSVLKKVDVVLLETNDGRPHLEQAREVFKSGKPVFIDKPVANSLQDVVTTYKEAAKNNIPMFSASSLRYMKTAVAVRYENKIGTVLGADTYSPAELKPQHPDLFYYGVHGVEILFTVMGAGCESVTRIQTPDTDIVVGKWKDGRVGTFRGTRTGKHEYGGTAYGKDGNLSLGPYDGYEGLVVKIAEFFKTKTSPIDPRETLEIYAFMEAADESKRQGGSSVRIDDVLKKAGYK